MPKDLREFLKEVEIEEPDQVLRVTREVDPHFEVTAILAKLEKERKFPIVIFEKVKGSALPVITNVHGRARGVGALPDVGFGSAGTSGDRAGVRNSPEAAQEGSPVWRIPGDLRARAKQPDRSSQSDYDAPQCAVPIELCRPCG